MRLLSALALVLVVTSAPALARSPYVEGRGGLMFLTDSVVAEAGASDVEVNFDPGFMFEGAVGIALDNGVRGDISVGYRRNTIDEVEEPNSVDLDGDVTTWTGMGNVYYDLDFERALGWTGPITIIQPFIGGGLGFARIYLALDDVNGVNVDKTETTYELAFQGTVGVGFHFSDHVALTTGYQFLGTTNPTFNGEEGSYKSHNLFVGLRFTF